MRASDIKWTGNEGFALRKPSKVAMIAKGRAAVAQPAGTRVRVRHQNVREGGIRRMMVK